MLQLERLSISFLQEEGWAPATREISLQLAPGKTLALVGESGSGKTITCLAILRLLEEKYTRYEGKILLNNQDILGFNSQQLRQLRGGQIGYIFQEPMSALNPVMRCGQQVLESVILHQRLKSKAAKAAVLKLFREVKLPDPERIFNAYPFQISGGQKQRVMIALALAGNPQYLIADEPTTALDPGVQKDILDLLRQLQKDRELAILFITHDLGILKDFADDTAILYKGELVEQLPTPKLWEGAQHPYTRGLLACRPSLKERYRRLPRLQDILEGKSEAVIPEQAIIPGNHAPVLSFRAVNKTFRSGTWFKPQSFKALQDINFELQKGETLALVGESGSGKTTTGRILAGLLNPDNGEILLNGNPLLPQLKSKAGRRKVQMVYQDPYASLNPRISIISAIMEPMMVYGLVPDKKAARERALNLLEKVALGPEFAQRYPHELSGGQRQRICLARALALEPEILLLDESVAALDVSVQAAVLNLLKSLQEELQLSYVFITHSMGVVRFLAHKVLLLKDGQMVEYAAADEFFAQPQSSYGQTLLQISH